MASQVESTKHVLDELHFEEGGETDPESEKLKYVHYSLLIKYNIKTKRFTYYIYRKLLTQVGQSPKDGSKSSTIIKLRPDSSNLVQTTRLAQLEHRYLFLSINLHIYYTNVLYYISILRLHKLESAVGPIPEKMERVAGNYSVENNKGLIATANMLASRISLLQPTQLDAAEQRLTRLLPTMDALRAAAPTDPERDQKVGFIFQFDHYLYWIGFDNIFILLDK